MRCFGMIPGARLPTMGFVKLFLVFTSFALGLAPRYATCWETRVVNQRLNTSERQNEPGVGDETRLTELGQRLRTVMFHAVTFEGVCSGSRHGGMDWRGMLPRFVAQQLGKNATVLVWNAKQAARDSNFAADCQLCRPDVPAWEPRPAFSCRGWFHRHGVQHADMVVVVGTGEKKCRDCINTVDSGTDFGELQWGLGQPWVSKETVALHIPISRQEKVLQNSVANFTAVVPDGRLVKPVHLPNMTAWRQQCRDTPRNKTLVYVARYHAWKGQLDFLRLADPQLLHGYTVEFFSGNRNPRMQLEMQEVADSRGIKVNIHDDPANRTELFQAMCSARGAVHFARTDANPRCVYESIMAELPVLLTAESRVPGIVKRQSFVFDIRFGDQKALSQKMGAFMSAVRGTHRTPWRRSMEDFIRNELTEDKALGKMCAKLRICKSTD